jgi:hypothetical protein
VNPEFWKAPGALSPAGRTFVRDSIIAELRSWKNQGRTFQQLWRVINEKLGFERGDANAPGYRATDAQLQVLRRSGEIYVQRFGNKSLWFLTGEKISE